MEGPLAEGDASGIFQGRADRVRCGYKRCLNTTTRKLMIKKSATIAGMVRYMAVKNKTYEEKYQKHIPVITAGGIL